MGWFKKLHWGWKVLIWFFVAAIYFNIGYWFYHWASYANAYPNTFGSYLVNNPCRVLDCVFGGPDKYIILVTYEIAWPVMVLLLLGTWGWFFLKYLWWFVFQGGMFRMVYSKLGVFIVEILIFAAIVVISALIREESSKNKK